SPLARRSSPRGQTVRYTPTLGGGRHCGTDAHDARGRAHSATSAHTRRRRRRSTRSPASRAPPRRPAPAAAPTPTAAAPWPWPAHRSRSAPPARSVQFLFLMMREYVQTPAAQPPARHRPAHAPEASRRRERMLLSFAHRPPTLRLRPQRRLQAYRPTHVATAYRPPLFGMLMKVATTKLWTK